MRLHAVLFQEMCEAATEATCILEHTRHEYEGIINNLEQVIDQMHQHHVEDLLRLKRRFSVLYFRRRV